MIPQTVKGFSLKNEMNFYKRKLGLDQFKVVEEKFPFIKKISILKSYPRTEELRVMQYIGNLLYCNDENKAFYEFGKDVFNYFAFSALGKTAFSLFKDPQTILLNIAKAFNTLSTGIEVFVYSNGPQSLKIVFQNESWPPVYYYAIIESVLIYLGCKPVIQEEIKASSYIFYVTW